ncbi:MAG TPA: glycosyltransferase [Phototrophicaceae bacterium]|nr:glycosyltransferase [Phototrophicaceae bacterium]
MALTITVIIPTKNRCELIRELLNSLENLRGLTRIQPNIIVGDNASADSTPKIVEMRKTSFPTELILLNVASPGKSAVLNQAIRRSTGEVLAFLDDDVVVDSSWLEEIENFFKSNPAHCVGQGKIRTGLGDSPDPEVRRLLQRYRTIPQLEFSSDIGDLHSLNGANIAIRRTVFDRVGYFDERLGPGASGTSEDVELAQRIRKAGMKIAYMPRALVYHRVDRERLTEKYFKQTHWRQGASRFLMKKRSSAEIICNLIRASGQYGYFTLFGKERDRYRSKGRIYHYLGMMDAKRNHTGP